MLKSRLRERVIIGWPNDLVINNKKFGRIIVETQDSTKLLRDYIVGIGINVNLKKR